MCRPFMSFFIQTPNKPDEEDHACSILPSNGPGLAGVALPVSGSSDQQLVFSETWLHRHPGSKSQTAWSLRVFLTGRKLNFSTFGVLIR